MLVLGIDTSCDDTSCAVVLDGWKVLSSIVSSQVDLHARFGGVVPEIASRRHLEMMVPVLDEALKTAGVQAEDLDAVAVTRGPGLLGSLLVGVCFAKGLAAGLSVPVVGVHHLEGHIFANFLRDDPPSFPLLNLVVSGGHSDLILMERFGSYEVLGETKDDAAGEVMDKVARELGLPFPGGPWMDRAALRGDPSAYVFPHPRMENPYDYSFSGMKTRALLAIEDAKRRAVPWDRVVADLSASMRSAIARDLLFNVPEAVRKTGAKALALSGGVAANSLLRSEAAELSAANGIALYIPPKEFCTDNGAMVAAAGFRRLAAGKADGFDLDAEAGLMLSPW